ncbi:alpha-tubulin N-acetyltransferase 1 isoform X1 [Patella vulgata]|uniref:alpha-tubulin N-acetyltransferase 1 isoform X1 n=1 Tax=Patella vulgata TaxID=6465 RepID=UPI0024A8A1FF|nr:alpha-tubulin N-acetyltransferase 1 isoform X1 [Patella vulgata]
MEFDFNVNPLLADIITKLDNRLMPSRNGQGRNGALQLRQQLYEVLDKMGEASARAQGLRGAITSGRKMELSDHKLYIMKDPEGSSGRGAVIGFLKTGKKKLFVYDYNGHHHEMEPLCVLDFYVHESRQRMGCGKRLFEYMLKCENVVPCHLAIDRPSIKFSSFLRKHYNLKKQIPQTNNFVVYDGFLDQPDAGRRRNGNRAYTSYPFNGYEENSCYGYRNRGGNPDGPLNGYNVNRPPSGSNRQNYNRPPSGKNSYNRAKNQVHPENQNIESNSYDRPPSHTRPPSGRNRSVVQPEGQGQVRSRPSSGNQGYRPSSGNKITLDALKQLNLGPRSKTSLPNTPPQQQQHLMIDMNNLRNNDSGVAGINMVYRRQPPSPQPLHRPNSQNTRPSYQTPTRPDSQERPPPYRVNNPSQVSPQQINLHQEYLGHGGHLKVNPVTGEKITSSLPKINGCDNKTVAVSNPPPLISWQTTQQTAHQDISWTVGNIQHNRGRHYQSRLW